MDRPSRCAATAQCTMIRGVTAPNPHAPRAAAHRPAPLKGGAGSTGRGLRVGVIDSLGESFVWVFKPWIADPVARLMRHGSRQ